MTTKEASIKFGIDVKEIRKSIKDGMLKAHKQSGVYELDKDIKFIPRKNDIQAFLFQILQYKNNPSTALNRSICPNVAQLSIIMEYLYEKGFIAQYDFKEDIKQLFDEVCLTEAGIIFSIGSGVVNKRMRDLNFTLSIPINVKIGLINT